MNLSEFNATEAGQETVKFSFDAFETNDPFPKNCHVAFGLMANSINGVGSAILKDLSVFCYENPDIAAKIWDAIKESVGVKR